jgi:hypothetical protein
MPVSEQAINTLRNVFGKVSPDSSDKYNQIGAQISNAKNQVLAKYQPIFSLDIRSQLLALIYRRS